MAKVINCGSLNIDHVYRVPYIVRPGETISSTRYDIHCGGKGANQSIALARAGAEVKHLGQIGKDGTLLKDKLGESGVDTEFIFTGDSPSGHAIIQVADDGENSIVLFPGANRKISGEQLNAAFICANSGDILLLQNETNVNETAIDKAFERGMTICLNPAPFDESIADLPLDKVNILIVNETEGQCLSGFRKQDDVIHELSMRWPRMAIVMTLGGKGALYAADGKLVQCAGIKVDAVDTTAAGDTFIGYFLAGKISGLTPDESMRLACAAASICVTRQGAMDSIPLLCDCAELTRK